MLSNFVAFFDIIYTLSTRILNDCQKQKIFTKIIVCYNEKIALFFKTVIFCPMIADEKTLLLNLPTSEQIKC